MKLQVSDKTISAVFQLIKSYNNATNTTIGNILGISRISVYHSIVELKRRKWIRPKAQRINNVVVYEILKKD